ncbi:rhodanese-like domain-containing protein [Brachybacterium saurashtrense]|uniref:Sulfurtransferase n=1 Tax=Brachybacterium saurashtrense TaxID=556288 RepID=A0A345YKC2_9MICO|nr:rhodanese-like domain-containing protein [Brachybacterium saurashtrense]AXK44374.1 sulfurtransferase [Brachybacterium saurashtrense]RRR22985.1 sulfurtransferase [Brachybacterium saurashtrense]
MTDAPGEQGPAAAHGRRRAETPAGRGVEELLAAARRGVDRLEPAELAAAQEAGAHVIDIRSAVTREPEGHIPGATVVERLVLEWRMDPGSAHRMEGGPGHDDLVVLVCNEGYSSSLAARDLRDLGFHRATDLVGGFRAYRAAGLPVATEPSRHVD